MRPRTRRWAGVGSGIAVLAAVGALALGELRPLVARYGVPGAAATPGVKSEFRGAVVAVRDGDTIVVRRRGRKVRVRVFGVDCPEHDQAFGAQATAFTRDHTAGRQVTIEVRDRDMYGRTVGEVILPDGENLGTELIRAGLAWHYRHYSHSPALDALEAEARAAHRGLWADAHPVPPWDFRHAQH